MSLLALMTLSAMAEKVWHELQLRAICFCSSTCGPPDVVLAKASTIALGAISLSILVFALTRPEPVTRRLAARLRCQ